MRERRNMVFPFLAPFGHSFALNDNRLDGDIAFDVNGERAQRIPSSWTPVDPGRRAHAPYVDDEQSGRAGSRDARSCDKAVRAAADRRRHRDRRDAQARRQTGRSIHERTTCRHGCGGRIPRPISVRRR